MSEIGKLERTAGCRQISDTDYAVGLLLIFLFSESKYDWMTDVDPSISPGAIEDASGNRDVFLGAVLAVVVAVQLIAAIKAKTTAERLISGALVIVAVLAFAAW